MVTPVTVPFSAFTGAIAVLLLLHVPPPIASDKLVEAPIQILAAPAIAGTEGETVIVVIELQPAPVV
jgi:hypothetical protein